MGREDMIETIQEVDHTLRFMAKIGCDGFVCSEKSLAIMDSWGRGFSVLTEDLPTIRNDLGDCRRCKLSKARTKIVFGAGNPQARLVFVGEGPGYDEDRQGEPFVGKAGQLLNRIIKAMELDREQVYICNIVKCRPPGNRNPEPDEIAACMPFLKRQLAAIQPEYICALGSVAARTLLETSTAISRMRGRFHDVDGLKILPTYHPAYLLRNPEKKRDVWDDMQMLMKALRGA